MSLGLTLPLASCDPVVEALAAFAAGEGEVAERDAVAQHLETCAACRDEQTASAGLRSLLLGAAPIHGTGGEADTAATEAGWGRLSAVLDGVAQEAEPVTISSAAHAAVAADPQPEEPVTKPLPRRNPWRSWLGAAAAAGFICLTAWGVSNLDDGSVTAVRTTTEQTPRILEGAMAQAGDDTATPIGALLPGTQAVALADGATVQSSARWTAALRSGTTITSADAGAVRLSNGEAVWHVVPRSGGLSVTTPHATVQVLGTLFSVKVEAARTVVAVYHGQVRVQDIGGNDTANTVGAGRAVAVSVSGAPVVLAAAPAPPEWLRPVAALSASLTPAGRGTRVRFALTNPGPGVCALIAPNGRDPHFAVSAARPGASDQPAVLQRMSVLPLADQRAAVAGRVLLGPGETYTVECNVAAALPEPGRYRLTARYAVAGNVPAGTFVGRAESAPVEVEVTR